MNGERASFFERHAGRILLAAAAAIPLVAWGSWHAYDRQDNSVLQWLPRDAPATQTYRAYLKDFGSDEVVLASWEGCTRDDPRLERFALAVEARVAAAEAGQAAAWFEEVVTGPRMVRQVAESADISETEAAGRLQGILVGPDLEATCGVVTLLPLEDAVRREAVEWIEAAAAEATGLGPEAIRLTGDAVIGVAIDIENEQAIARWSNLSMALAFLLALVSLGSLRLGSLVFGFAGLCLLSCEAIVYFSGGSMNLLVTLVPVVVNVLATSAAVHLCHYFSEAAAGGAGPRAASMAVAAGAWPCGVAAATTVIGLGSLAVSEVEPVRLFGIYAAAGVAVSFGMLMTVLPSALQWFPGRAATRPARLSPSLLCGIAEAILARRRMIVAIAAAILLTAGSGLVSLRTEVKPATFLPPASRWITDLEWFNRHLGPFQSVEMLLAIDDPAVSLAERAVLTDEAGRRLAGLAQVRGVFSAATFLPDEVLAVDHSGSVRAVVRRRLVRERLAESLPALERAGVVVEAVPTGSGAEATAAVVPPQVWRVGLRVADFESDSYLRFLESAKEIVAESVGELGLAGEVGVVATGGVPLVFASQRALLGELLTSFVLAFVMISVVLSLLLGSLSMGLLAMLPNIFPVAVVFGLLGWLGRPVDVGGMMTASVALGIAVDDTVHFLIWFRRARNAGATVAAGVREAFVHCAAPILQTSVILGVAFFVFFFSSFVPVSQFGLLMASLLAMAVVGDLLLLPALVAVPPAAAGSGPAESDFADRPGEDGLGRVARPAELADRQ